MRRKGTFKNESDLSCLDLIHYMLTFVYVVRSGLGFIFFSHVVLHLFQLYFLK